ncbi:MAG: ABC transporter permease subunit [Pseudonocardiaceae bacterium]|nr:ABC transporter permease subunit [Pseudonocardiaceae bacterium]
MEREKWMKLLPWISTPILLALVIGGWDLAITAFGVSPYVLPRPGTVAETLSEMVVEADTWEHIQATVVETVVGFVIALVLGIAMGVTLGKIRWLEVAVRPLIVASQVIPKVALIPLFVIWFGFGITSKVIMALLLAFFPIMLNVLLGVRSVDPGHQDVMRSLDAGRWQTLRHLELKSTLPYVFAGMEVGIVFALIGAIVGEYLGGSQGLGFLVVETLNALDGPRLFGVIILLAFLGSLMFFAINGLKRIFIPWHESVISAQ